MISSRNVRRIWRQRKRNNGCYFVVKSFSFCGKMSQVENADMEWIVFNFAADN